MPTPFDILTRPTKYVRGGNGFVVVTTGVESYFISTSGDTVQELSLPDTEYGAFAGGNAVSYHGGVYVLSGVTISEDAEGDSAAVIYVSDDGKKWSVAFLGPTGAVQSVATALVWKDGKFHAAYLTYILQEGEPTIGTEWEISSKDGASWSGGASIAGVGQSEEEGHRSPFPGMYCTHHSCTDEFGQHVPDGFQGASVQPVMPAAVRYGAGFVYPSSGAASNSVKIIKSDGHAAVETVGPLTDVWCVAAIGGSWLAGGSDGVAISTDGGKGWSKIGGVRGGACIAGSA